MNYLNLDQRPCVVNYLDNIDRFILGTYELISDQDGKQNPIEEGTLDYNIGVEHASITLEKLNKINYRAGKLIIINVGSKEPIIEETYSCESGGGIFDLKTIYHDAVHVYLVYVAHSNGLLSTYRLEGDSKKISLQSSIKISDSTMLTCLDVLFDCNDLYQEVELNSDVVEHEGNIVVGNSSGSIFVLTDDSDSVQKQVTQSGYSIWQVRIVKATKVNLIIVAAEDSNWYIFDYTNKELNLLHTISKHFESGVTCLSIDYINLSGEQDVIKLLVGSYDETIKSYKLTMRYGSKSILDVAIEKSLTIKNGGIWRIKKVYNKPSKFIVASMYAGTFLISHDDELLKQESLFISVEDSDNALHYDADTSRELVGCVVDFNNRRCIFKRIHNSDF